MHTQNERCPAFGWRSFCARGPCVDYSGSVVKGVPGLDHHASQPIGFFDSGEGGLTVARVVAQLLPG